jgi:hypothetical protein
MEKGEREKKGREEERLRRGEERRRKGREGHKWVRKRGFWDFCAQKTELFLDRVPLFE